MSRENRPSDPELETLLERGRIIRPVPDVVRARALARARAHATTAAAPAVEDTSASPARSRRLRFALAASLAMIAGAAGTAAALYNHVHRVPEPAPSATLPAAAQVHVPAPLQPLQPLPTPSQPAPSAPSVAPFVRVAKPARAARPLTPQESYAAELDLLQRAQAAYAGRSFSRALALVVEHGRQFPNGRLAEEREALRVKSLAASGRADEAHSAAATFADRFPRSVLLPRLQKMANGAE